jgi:hypothetical protein
LKLELSERNLRPELVSQANITRLKILNEGGNEQTPFGEKFTLRVLANDSQKTKFKLQLNVTNKNYLITALGNETADWIGKEVGITLKLMDNGKQGMVLTQ